MRRLRSSLLGPLCLLATVYACKKTEGSSPTAFSDAGGGRDGSTEPSDSGLLGTNDSGPAPKDAAAPPPSCADLQAQLEACPDLPSGPKPTFSTFCAKVSSDCRACFNGKMCGVSTSCAEACQVAASTSCATLQDQIDACDNIPPTSQTGFASFCQGASTSCRACLDGNLCGVTEQCDPLCKK